MLNSGTSELARACLNDAEPEAGSMSRSFTELDPSWWIDQGDYFSAHSEFWFDAANIRDSKCDLTLDVGSGHGRFTMPLAGISRTVVSTDINRKMLESLRVRAKSLSAMDKICLVVSDAQHLPFRDCCFDMVNFIGTMVHIPNQKKAVRETYRVAKEGARVIIDQTNYLSLRFFWEGLKTVFARVVKARGTASQRFFSKRCNLSGFRKMFREAGLSVVKVEGFQVVPFLPLFGLRHDARSYIIPLRIANRLDKSYRRTRLIWFAFNILIIGVKE
jgi:ubiquinone/menaquinone biosynthesis C-methylase UbiE